MMQGTTLSTPTRHYRRHPVTKSTGTASNPRQRKPKFQDLSLSASSVVSGHQVEMENIPSSSHKMPTQPVEEEAQVPETEGLFLLHFQRSSPDFQQRLRSDARLEPCRQALEAAGCRWFLREEEVHKGRFGVKVFVHPAQYYQALQLLRRHHSGNLYARHVLVSESFLPLVQETLKGCTGGGATLKRKDGKVKVGELSRRLMARMEEAGMAMRGSTLNTQRQYHRHPVVKSTSTASNPRRRKPNFQTFSLSESSVVSGNEVNIHTATSAAVSGNQGSFRADAYQPENLMADVTGDSPGGHAPEDPHHGRVGHHQDLCGGPHHREGSRGHRGPKDLHHGSKGSRGSEDLPRGLFCSSSWIGSKRGALPELRLLGTADLLR